MRSPLGRLVPKPVTSEYEMKELRRRTWLEQEIAVLPVKDLPDDWERQIVTNIANRVYGKAER